MDNIMKATPLTVTDIEQAVESTGNSQVSERIQLLGIPPEQMTPAVGLAVSALLERMDDMSRELTRTKDYLSEIEQLVDVDCVAPIPNRRAFMRRLSWAVAMQQRYGHPTALLYFDLNGFKTINDNHGHAAGDMAIRHVSKLLAGTMRESDFIARIGGDEFAIIMYYASEDAARRRGRKIVESLYENPLSYNGTIIPLSTAFGYYAVKPGDDAESALSAADTSMYVDKRRIRDAISHVKAKA